MRTDVQLATGPSEKPSPNSTVTLFLSLYVVLLAFFILLFSHASFDEERTEHVLQSVNQAFTSISPAKRADPRLTALTNELTVGDVFEALQGSLAAVIPLEEMSFVTHGRKLFVTMESTALYNAGNPHLRYDRGDFFERLSETMTRWQSGIAVHLTMIQSLPHEVGDASTANYALNITRGGNFARFMENHGIAPEHLAIALEQADEDTVTLVFEVLKTTDDAGAAP